MRFFSILLAGVFLAVVGCGGDATDSSTGGTPGPTGEEYQPDDPKDMPTDPVSYTHLTLPTIYSV